ncbi:MAG: DUF4105 domain-containing protein [Pseudomonadota bacterium]|nr:DUF4105 domain-containing protein [Pseudomonadota bacterium]
MWLLIAAAFAAAVGDEVAPLGDGPVTDTVVSGTTWRLDGTWPAELARSIGTLPALLPEEYRQPGRVVHFRLTPSGEARSDAPHTLARLDWGSARVTLYVEGLAERLRTLGGVAAVGADEATLARAADTLAQRAVVHELTHLVDRRRGWSRKRDWRGISGWSWLTRLPGPLPLASTGEFAAPYGARSPAEDLATFAEVYFLPPPVGPTGADDHPRCRFPTKFRFFAERLGPHPDPAPEVRCATPADVGLAPDQVGDVEILWATPTMSSAAAVGGHLLLSFQRDGADTRETWAMLADPGGLVSGTPAYAIMGIAGGFPARVQSAPEPTTLLHYVADENRDVVRLRWNLTDPEKARLIARLDDLVLHWHRPYFFFQRNCSALIVELANAVEARPLHTPAVVPPDLVLAQLARRGRLTRVPPDPARDLAPVTRARLARDARTAALRTLCGAPVPGANAGSASRRDVAYADMLARATARDDGTCWSELARVLSLSASLEADARLRTNEPMPGYLAARQSLRGHLPLATLAAIDAELDAELGASLGDGPGAEGAAGRTPYDPYGAGVAWVHETGTPGVPMLYVRRDGLDLVRSAPRAFSPARGVDAAFLSGEVAIGRVEDHVDLYARQRLLRLRYVPDPILPGPGLGRGFSLLGAELHTAARRARVEWAGLEGVLALAGTGPNTLDLTGGVTVGTVFSWGGGESYSDLTTPVRVEAVAHTLGGPHIGVAATAGWIPSLDTRGRLDHALEGEARGWMFLGSVAGAGMTLEARARGAYALSSTSVDRPLVAMVGLRFQRW